MSGQIIADLFQREIGDDPVKVARRFALDGDHRRGAQHIQGFEVHVLARDQQRIGEGLG
jgi:hypothetical protein